VELESQPDKPCIVDGVIPSGGLVVPWGQSGHFKTFVALDLSCRMALGLPWHGHLVLKPGRVVYVIGEGGGGMRRRLAAWKLHNGFHGKSVDVVFLPRPVDMLDPGEMRAFGSAILDLGSAPVAVVFDTLARCFFSGDESTTADMNRAVGRMTALSGQLHGATMIPIHHNGWTATDRMRGSSALYAAADVVMKVSSDGRQVTIDSNPPGGKTKDFEAFKTIRHSVIPVADSLVVGITGEEILTPEYLSKNELAALDEVLQSFTESGASFTEWRLAATESPTHKVPFGSFGRTRNALLERGLVETFDLGKRERYRITALGRVTLRLNYQNGIKTESPTVAERSITGIIPLLGVMPDTTADLAGPRDD